MTSTSQRLGLSATCLLLCACQAPMPAPAPTAPPRGATELRPVTIHASASCGRAQPSVHPVQDQAALTQVITGGRALGADQPPVPMVDFASSMVMLLSMGQQPSAGYQIGVTAATVRLDSRVLTVSSLWQQPEPGVMQATVVTQPCVIFSLPRGDYSALQIVDQQRQERMLVDLTPAAR
jgi:hypothetical protein